MIFVRFAWGIALLGALPCMAQQPLIFDVSTVTIGAQKLETVYAFAEGKWSDAGPDVGINSIDIHCYKRFSFCEVASAISSARVASVSLDSFDILRWDVSELIAVDSSPVCLVNTLRFDFAAKKVSISSASKGETRSQICKNLTASMPATAFLTGALGETERQKR